MFSMAAPKQAPETSRGRSLGLGGGLEQIDQLSDAQVLELHQLYEEEWWTKGRAMEDIRRMLRCCDVIVAFAEPDGRLAAFARVLTDYVYKALVYDVIVARPHRRTGLGRALMEAIVNHPKLRAVPHIELYCLPELVPFYQRWGFTTDLGHLKFMRRTVEQLKG
jgi:GNAT superfamily N-acetyltransferase